MSDQKKGYLRQKDAAEYLGVTARYLRAQKDIRPVEMPSMHGVRPLLRYAIAELDAWIARHNKGRKVA